MDAFGDDSDFAAAPGAGETSDPAADFLAREQAELGEDLGQELGLDAGLAPSPPQATLDEVNINMRKKPKYIECGIFPLIHLFETLTYNILH